MRLYASILNTGSLDSSQIKCVPITELEKQGPRESQIFERRLTKKGK